MSIWDKKQNSPANPALQEPLLQTEVTLDEEAVSEMQNEEFDVFDDEEEDTAFLMNDANLRLEQGRLYQMVLQGNIFADTNADPKAIRNVQREIRKFVRERMETMLGIRQEQAAPQQIIVSERFNDMEVTVLKMLASKMSKGATESVSSAAQTSAPVQPKKDGITSISGNLRPKDNTASLNSSNPKQQTGVQKSSRSDQSKQKPKSAINKKEESFLQKPIGEMTPEELVAYNKEAEERSKKTYATMPNNMMPHPNPQQLEMLYTQSAAQLSIANPWRANG